MSKMSGGDALISSLEREGVEVIFGLPGVQMYGVVDALRRNKNITLRNIAYLCEKNLVEYTKGTMVSQRLTNIVKDILNNEIFFVKMNIDNGVPRFTISSTSDRSVSNLHFRNKNGYDSTSDKLGFKL